MNPTYRWTGVVVASALITAWAVTLCVGLSGLVVGAWAAPWVVLTGFLYTGLFITAHDAMHRLVAPAHPVLNHSMGRLAAWLYAAMPYGVLHAAHHEHHAHPASHDDPDYHEGGGGFFGWYARFFLRYATVTQFVVMAIVFNALHHGLQIPLQRLWLFWIVPQLLSTLQLFGVGTWWPHRDGEYEDDAHRARSLDLPVWASFFACYHFGYHHAHHASPWVPWWQLPREHRRYRAAMTAVASALCLLLPGAGGATEPATLHAAFLVGAERGGVIDLTGQWVQRQDTMTISRIATVGRVRSTTTSVILYDLQHDGESLTGTGRVCDVAIVSDPSFVGTTLPDAFVRSIPAPRLDAQLEQRNGALVLRQREVWTVIGADLDAPITDPLPETPNDPRVCDDDGDGNPGVTVQIDGLVDGEVYLVQRGWSEFEGELDNAAGAFRGEVRFGQEQVVLDASRRVLRNQPPTEPADAPGANTFVMAPVGPNAGCREAVELALRLGR